jgi:hypothetical protein
MESQQSPSLKPRKLSKLKITKRSTNVVSPFTGELDLKNRILAITEGIRAHKKKQHSNSILYNNFDPTFSDDKSLDVSH